MCLKGTHGQLQNIPFIQLGKNVSYFMYVCFLYIFAYLKFFVKASPQLVFIKTFSARMLVWLNIIHVVTKNKQPHSYCKYIGCPQECYGSTSVLHVYICMNLHCQGTASAVIGMVIYLITAVKDYATRWGNTTCFHTPFHSETTLLITAVMCPP